MQAGQTGTTERRQQPMLAVVHDRYGTADVLRLEHIPRPDPAVGEVLVRVHAAGVDRGTWHLMTGRPYIARIALGVRRPKDPVPGRDVAGIVVESRAEPGRFSPGDRVYGMGRGSFAEYAVVRQDRLAPMPAALSFEQAAAIPISGGTALQALTDAGRLEAGQAVLVLGASGGVGSYAVQIARAMGGRVTAVCSGAKADFVRSIGAEKVFDYARDDFAEPGGQFDLIIDAGGGAKLSRLRRALNRRGTLVVGSETGSGFLGGLTRPMRAMLLSPFVSQRLIMLASKERGSDLERLAPYLADGRVVPPVDHVYPLEEAAQALRDLEAGRLRGKAVIRVAADA